MAVVRQRRTATTAVRVEGLSQLQRALRMADSQLRRELARTNRTAAEWLVDRARQVATGRQAQRAADTALSAKGEQRYGVMVLSDSKLPWAFGANFGAYHNRFRAHLGGLGWNQFPEWGGNQHTGGARDQFLYNAIERFNAPFTDRYGDMLDDLLRRIERF